MKLCTAQHSLSGAVSAVAPALPRRPPVPALAGLQIKATPDSVLLSASDYELFSRAAARDTQVHEPGTVVVAGRLFAEIVKALPVGPVDLSANDNDLTISCGASQFTLPLLPADGYPAMPAVSAASGFADRAALAMAVSQAAVAAGRDDSLPMLTGVQLELHPTFLRLVSTDRFRIAIRELGWRPAVPLAAPACALVPARALTGAAKVLAGADTEISCGPGQSTVTLTTATQQHTLRTLDMQFAPYQRYLSPGATTSARVDCAGLTATIKRVSLVSPLGTQVRLQCSANGIRVCAASGDMGSAQEVIPCEFSGEPLTIAFNPRYLVEGIAMLSSEYIDISFNGPHKAATLSRCGSETGYRMLYILMPIRVAG